MALPFILLAGAFGLGTTGIITGANGTMKITDAKKAVETAEKLYDIKKTEFDIQRRRIVNELERLAFIQNQSQASFSRFADAFEKIQNRPELANTKNANVEFQDISLDNIKTISIKAIGILGGSVLSAAAGTATGAITYAGTMTFGYASTGAAISGLHGIAANNAALAFLGGGSIKAGGFGMALGKVALGGAVAGPVLAVAGLLTQYKGRESQEKAEEIVAKVDETIALMNQSAGYMNRLRHLSMKLRYSIERLFTLYLDRVAKLEELVENETNYLNYSDEEKDLIDNNILIIKTLAHLTRLPLIEPSKEEIKEMEDKQEKAIDEIEMQEEEPEYQQDKTDQFQGIILTDQIDKEINLAKETIPTAF